MHNNVIFKNENSIFGKLEKFFWKLWSTEGFRFLFAGGLNTVIGLVLTILTRMVFDAFGWDPKLTNDTIQIGGYVLLSLDIPSIICFIIGIPIAYTNQTLIAFKVKWNWGGFARYPLSTIPNFILQQICILIFEIWLGVPAWVSYILSATLPLPIMFFIIRFLVKPLKKKTKNEEVSTNETSETQD